MNLDEPPVYGCLTGIELDKEQFELVPGFSLRRVYVDTFGTTMMAFSPPPNPKSAHPGPWASVRGGFLFESRVEIALRNSDVLDGFAPSSAMWLVGAVLRVKVRAPIRLAVVGKLPFDQMKAEEISLKVVAFESAPNQWGVFESNRTILTEEQLDWLKEALPVSGRLYHEERFFRAFTIYDQAQWAVTPEQGASLIWTSLEILFDLTGERDKTKAICGALSDYVGANSQDRDRAYQVIRDLYFERGRAVHAGRRIESRNVLQTFQFANAAFRRVINEGRLPSPKAPVLH